MIVQDQATNQSTKRFSEKDVERIKGLDDDQKRFKQYVTSSKHLSGVEKAAAHLSTFAEFESFWQNTNDRKNEFDQKHERGCGLFSRKYQTSASVARSFVKDFTPILEIVQNFAAPYGGLAVGTISVFFVIAGKKDDTEEKLASALSAIRNRLPGLSLYRHIYNDDDELDVRLQTQIVSAYQVFIEFCIAASKYYSMGGARRWLKALGRPKSILDKANEVQDEIGEVRKSCDELLDKNVNTIKRLNIDQKTAIEKLQDKIQQISQAQNNNTLTEIQGLFGLSTFSYETQRNDLAHYRETLESDEQLNAFYFEQMRGQRLDLFISCGKYKSWIDVEQPCLLILSGLNNQSISDLDQCWLSPVAMAKIADLELSHSDTIYAYYVFGARGENVYHALSVVLLHLLSQKRDILRNKTQCDELIAELRELKAYGCEGSTTSNLKLSAFYKVAVRVMGFFNESETAYIVLDRVDRCRDVKDGTDHRKPLLKAIVKMVEAARCKLKVLVVINGYQWRVDERQDELGSRMQDRLMMLEVEQGDSE